MTIVDKKPETVEGLKALLEECKSPTAKERYIMSHNTLPGEDLPRPCPCCCFGHDPSTVLADQKAMYEEEARLAADKTKAGKARFSKWRMEYAQKHGNVQPGLYGEPMLRHDLDSQLLDPLHLAELGVPKTPWKHGVLNNASDDARERISEQLKEWKHPLDCRRKEDNRCRADKWFTGEAWASFCAGTGGSPGGPRAIAALVKIIADDLQLRGVASGMAVHTASQPLQPSPTNTSSAPARGGRGRAAFAANRGRGRSGSTAVPVAQLQQESDEELTRTPTAIERAADPEDLAVIRELFGSRANAIINTLLSFDAYFAWYYPLKESLPFRCEMALREQRSLDNARRAIDMHEIIERVTIRNHKSFLFHGAIYKVSRDILKVGDVWATDLSPLELQNAETKRVASAGGAKRLTVSGASEKLVPPPEGAAGPHQLVKRRAFPTTMALSTLRKLLSKGYLRRGDGVACIPDARRAERLFGQGRSKTERAGACKMELLGQDYDPRQDTCLKAFVRLLALQAPPQPPP